MNESYEQLRERVLSFIDSMGASESFEALALDVFTHQFENCMPFRELCRYRGIEGPGAVTSVSEVPLVPTESFKLYRLACFPPSADEVRFETSGTTRGRPGVHAMRDTGLYDAAAMAWFRRHVLSDGRSRRFLSLTGSPRTMPHSSLVHMIDVAGRRFGLGGGTEYFFEGDTPDVDRLARAIAEAGEHGEAVLILTTAFALVHTLEHAAGSGLKCPLPRGSRVMETGGYKGRSRELAITELYERASELFEIEPAAMINEYGMTEMASQFYDRTDARGALDPMAERVKAAPPWVRSTVLRPSTLAAVEPGEIGMLAHVDLANLDSCSFLLTADAALRTDEGFMLLGRLAGSDLRGCSLDYERTA